MYTRAVLLLAAITAHIPSFSQWSLTNEEGLFGYTHAITGETIPHIYENAFEFNGSTALVVNNGQYQLIDTGGNTIASFPYNMVMPIEGSASYTFYGDSVVGVISETGQIVDEIHAEKMYRWGENNQGYVLFNGNKLGIFTTSHGLTLPVEYETDDFENTFVYDGNLYFYDSSYFCLKRNNKWGVISMYGDVRIPFEYDRLVQPQDDNIGALKNGKWALLEKNTGKPLTEFEYDGFLGRYKSPIHIPRAEDPYIFLKDDKVVFFDLLSGKTIAQVPPAQYEWQVPNRLFVTHNGKRGAIDPAGKILVPFVYDNVWNAGIETVKGQAAFAVASQGKTGILLSDGNFLFPLMECDAMRIEMIMNTMFFVVIKNNSCALYNSEQKPLTGFDFDTISVTDNRIYVTDGDKNGILSTTGVVTWNK